MTDSNDSSLRPTRRNVLKVAGGSLAGFTGLMAADTAAAQYASVHRKCARTSADNMAQKLDNSLSDYVDTISEYGPDPDNDPYYCDSDVSDDICDFLTTVDQSYGHYLNTERSPETGDAHVNGADEAAAAESRVNNNDYLEAAIKTGRATHFFIDAATPVHTGRELEQGDNYDIHFDFESWVANNFDDYFADNADQTWDDYIDSKSDVQSHIHDQAYMSNSWLNEQWYDFKNPGSYDTDTRDAQGYCFNDAQIYSNGMITWVWQNA